MAEDPDHRHAHGPRAGEEGAAGRSDALSQSSDHHGHGVPGVGGIAGALDAAEAHCLRHGASLTPLRRQVLGVVLAADAPIGAYAILDRLKGLRGSAAPPTVYRALDFLLERQLVHRVERLNAFVPCAVPGEGTEAPHDHDACAHHHEGSAPPQFLICGRCGTVAELADEAVVARIEAAARGLGFTPARLTIEVEGVCARCGAA